MQIAQQKSRRQLHLLLLGDGPMYEKLKNVALPNVHVLGFQPNVRDYFMASDMGLLPSRFSGESFPLVLIECLLSGRPAIASDLGEIRNILTDPGNRPASRPDIFPERRRDSRGGACGTDVPVCAGRGALPGAV